MIPVLFTFSDINRMFLGNHITQEGGKKNSLTVTLYYLFPGKNWILTSCRDSRKFVTLFSNNCNFLHAIFKYAFAVSFESAKRVRDLFC